jgi:hypothetical protein
LQSTTQCSGKSAGKLNPAPDKAALNLAANTLARPLTWQSSGLAYRKPLTLFVEQLLTLQTNAASWPMPISPMTPQCWLDKHLGEHVKTANCP